MYPAHRSCYQTKVNSALQLRSARHKHGGEGTNQQRGPEDRTRDGWFGLDHDAQHHTGLMPHVYISCRVPMRGAIPGAGTKENTLSQPRQIPLQLLMKDFQLGKGYVVCAPAAVSPKYGKNLLGVASEFITWQSHYVPMKSWRTD